MSKKLYKSFGYKIMHIIILMLYSILLVPILLNLWDLQVYGAWIAIYAFFNLFQVTELGHSIYVGNEFNRIHHEDEFRAKSILGSAIRFNLVIGVLQIILILSLHAFGFLKLFLDSDIDENVITTVLIILFVYRMVIGSFRGIVAKILNPFGYIYKSFQFQMTEKVIEFGILVSAAVMGITLVQLALLWLAVKFVYTLIILFELKRILPDFFPWWRYGDFKTGFKNFKVSLDYVASSFLDRLGNDGIVLVVSALVGTTFLPLFAATRTIVNMGVKLSDVFLSPMAPEMINYYARKQYRNILDTFKSYWLVNSAVLMFGFTASLFFIEEIFEFWTNGKLEFNLALYSSLVVLMFLQTYGKVMMIFFRGINKTRVVLYNSIIRIVVFFAMIFFLRSMELTGVLISLILAELVVSIWWLPKNSFNIFELNMKDKVTFYLYVYGTLILTVLFYLNLKEFPFWITFSLVIPIVYLVVLQYRLISSEARAAVRKSIRKLTTFASKRK